MKRARLTLRERGVFQHREGESQAAGALTCMGVFDGTDSGSAFALDLVRAGSMLTGLAADIIEDLSPDAFPGEDSAAVVIEMIIGTIRSALGDVDESDLRRASELIGVACDRVLEHLRLALELRLRMEGAQEAPSRSAPEQA